MFYYSYHLTVTKTSEVTSIEYEWFTIMKPFMKPFIFIVHDNFDTIAHLYMATHYLPECE